MRTLPDMRKERRFRHRATVMLEDSQNGNLSYGQIINYSEGGMLIATSTFFELGTRINVSFSKPIFKAAPRTYCTTVRWCNEISTDFLAHDFGVGLKYI